MITKDLPKEPGVYLFKDGSGTIIYIGKAKSLRARVSSYFKSGVSGKTRFLVKHIRDMDHIVVRNEVEALLLENKLIKKHKPKYNISLKDSKTYAYIKLTDEPFPRILSTRTVSKKGTYIGPFTDGSARNELVQLAIRLFKLRVCKTLPKRACLNYHIGLCSAPCIAMATKEQYALQVEKAIRFLKGDAKEVVSTLKKEMKIASDELKFELAQEKKRQLEAIEHMQYKQQVEHVRDYDQDVIVLKGRGSLGVFEVFSVKKGILCGRKEYQLEQEEDLFESFVKAYYAIEPVPREIIVNQAFWKGDEKKVLEAYLCRLRGGVVSLTLPQKGIKLDLVKLVEKNIPTELESLQALQSKLNLTELPSVIECFDISNFGKEGLVAGMTRFVDGKPNKEGYRKFEIKSFAGKSDDFASMREVVFRRYKRLVEEKKAFPNLIIVDGGMGQLSAALSSLKRLGLAIPVIGLAKENEEIYLPNTSTPLQFNQNSKMMLLIRNIRNHTHRFAITYNRKKRQMNLRDQIREV